MKNTSVKKLNYSSHFSDYCLTPEEDAEFMANIDMEALDKIIEDIEKTEDDPNEWIPFDEAMDEIRRDILNE